jgi:hypothetical protein
MQSPTYSRPFSLSQGKKESQEPLSWENPGAIPRTSRYPSGAGPMATSRETSSYFPATRTFITMPPVPR